MPQSFRELRAWTMFDTLQTKSELSLRLRLRTTKHDRWMAVGILKKKGHEAENLRTGILEQCGMVITNLPRSDQYSTQLVRVEGYNEEMYRSKATKPVLRTLARKSTRRKPYDKEKRSEWLWISSKTSDETQLISTLTMAEGQSLAGWERQHRRPPQMSEGG